MAYFIRGTSTFINSLGSKSAIRPWSHRPCRTRGLEGNFAHLNPEDMANLSYRIARALTRPGGKANFFCSDRRLARISGSGRWRSSSVRGLVEYRRPSRRQGAEGRRVWREELARADTCHDADGRDILTASLGLRQASVQSRVSVDDHHLRWQHFVENPRVDDVLIYFLKHDLWVFVPAPSFPPLLPAIHTKIATAHLFSIYTS